MRSGASHFARSRRPWPRILRQAPELISAMHRPDAVGKISGPLGQSRSVFTSNLTAFIGIAPGQSERPTKTRNPAEAGLPCCAFMGMRRHGAPCRAMTTGSYHSWCAPSTCGHFRACRHRGCRKISGPPLRKVVGEADYAGAAQERGAASPRPDSPHSIRHGSSFSPRMSLLPFSRPIGRDGFMQSI